MDHTQAATSPFNENVIAVIWDFDKTLIEGNMQRPLFEHFGVDEVNFWRETNNLATYYKARGNNLLISDTVYLNHIITYAKAGIFKGLNNTLLHDIGSKIGQSPAFFPGVSEIFDHCANTASTYAQTHGLDVKLEHYIISTGLKAMIDGCAIRKHFKDVWGCTFIEDPAQPGYLEGKVTGAPTEPKGIISQLGYVIDNTSKTRCIFEINKGCNVRPEIDVNAHMPASARRVPFKNMIYVADGISDVPVFSLIKQYNGRTLAVYDPKSKRAYNQAEMMMEDGRVHHFCPADYTAGSPARMWLTKRIEHMVDDIAKRVAQDLAETVSTPLGHPLSGKDD